jgi:hypothetical protein
LRSSIIHADATTSRRVDARSVRQAARLEWTWRRQPCKGVENVEDVVDIRVSITVARLDIGGFHWEETAKRIQRQQNVVDVYVAVPARSRLNVTLNARESLRPYSSCAPTESQRNPTQSSE